MSRSQTCSHAQTGPDEHEWTCYTCGARWVDLDVLRALVEALPACGFEVVTVHREPGAFYGNVVQGQPVAHQPTYAEISEARRTGNEVNGVRARVCGRPATKEDQHYDDGSSWFCDEHGTQGTWVCPDADWGDALRAALALLGKT